MSLRTRLLLALSLVVLIPIALLAFGLRREMTRRLSGEYQRRVDLVVATMREDLEHESAGIAARLGSLESALVNDNRFRAAAVAQVEEERKYLLDYAGTAMHLTGLSMLQIQDGDGRIISSGHFRNEHGRVDTALARALASARGPTFVATRDAERPFLALARVKSFVLADRPFTIVGGVIVDEAFLARLARDPAVAVSFTYPGGRLATASSPPVHTDGQGTGTTENVAVGEFETTIVQTGSGAQDSVAAMGRFRVTQSLAPLRALLRSSDAWLLGAAVGTSVAALLLGVWVSARLSSRLTALAEKTAVLDLDRLDVDFDSGSDEVGRLSRLLGDLAGRLRTSTARVREAERRATVGDLARQVNHDIKNGLIPLRNVMRHLAQVEREQPAALPQVFAERRQTVDLSLAYLETLATSYQRLSRPIERRDCDLNAIVDDVVRAAQGHDHVELTTELTPVPRTFGDPVAFRRILENLIANAVDSLQAKPGRITVATQVINREADRPIVRVVVSDTGRGMTSEETEQIFNDFYTTKEGGTGLGLSIVRRLVMDLNGTVGVESAPGRGTRIFIELPIAATRP